MDNAVSGMGWLAGDKLISHLGRSSISLPWLLVPMASLLCQRASWLEEIWDNRGCCGRLDRPYDMPRRAGGIPAVACMSN